VDLLNLGVIAQSRKQNERRLPIHPAHFQRIDEDLRPHVLVEQGYGLPFGVSDDQLAPLVGGLRPREELIADSDVVLLPKMQPSDLSELRDGQTVWGWPHCVQDVEITQLAIDRRLTLIAYEAMNHFTKDGGFSLHVFHKNNELAGYASVLHALQLTGSTGHYGPRLTAAVIGFGATARGAVTALSALGVTDVTVLTTREVAAVASPIHSAQIVQMSRDASDPERGTVETGEGEEVPLARFLAQHDIVVNCVLQDPNAPQVFVHDEDLGSFAPGSLIVDVSCDEGMGFSWARPTTFDDPMFTVGSGIAYYAVDHTPSLLWKSATWEISEALLPHLRTVLSGAGSWASDEVISRAIEIRDGVIQNPGILSFQHRSPDYPHARVG
jgi:alanine dehydrogenase